jgi:signal transduction histidine kinase
VLSTVKRNLQSSIDECGASLLYDAESLPSVRGDSALLVSVLQNLVANALKFRRDEPPRVQVSAQRDDDHSWRIIVADNGIGIAPEDQDRIFAMFGRLGPGTERAGVGLGLALCERLVTRLGGRLGVESEPDVGSRFWFTIAASD